MLTPRTRACTRPSPHSLSFSLSLYRDRRGKANPTPPRAPARPHVKAGLWTSTGGLRPLVARLYKSSAEDSPPMAASRHGTREEACPHREGSPLSATGRLQSRSTTKAANTITYIVPPNTNTQL